MLDIEMLFKAMSSVEKTFDKELYAEPSGSFMLKGQGTIKVGSTSKVGGKSGE